MCWISLVPFPLSSWFNCFTASCCSGTTSGSLPGPLLRCATHLSLSALGLLCCYCLGHLRETHSAILMRAKCRSRRVLTPHRKSGNSESHSTQLIRGFPAYSICISIDVYSCIFSIESLWKNTQRTSVILVSRK